MTGAPSPPRCRFCGAVLHDLHGHEACQTPGCPLHGVVQEDCCSGAPLSRSRDADDPATPAPAIPWTPDRR